MFQSCRLQVHATFDIEMHAHARPVTILAMLNESGWRRRKIYSRSLGLFLRTVKDKTFVMKLQFNALSQILTSEIFLTSYDPLLYG